MAFFDKLNDFAKNVGDKTKDAMETSKLNAKIRTENANIDSAYKKLGAYFYEKHTADAIQDEEAEEIFAAIDASKAAIVEFEAEIAQIKAEKEAKEAEIAQNRAEKATKAATDKEPEPVITSGLACPTCGKLNSPETKFCGGCGTKVEPIPQKEATGAACPNCGVQNPDGTKFCGSCGTKIEVVQENKQEVTEYTVEAEVSVIPETTDVSEASDATEEPVVPVIPEEPEEPVKEVCPTCGIELSDAIKFCSNCGTKIE